MSDQLQFPPIGATEAHESPRYRVRRSARNGAFVVWDAATERPTGEPTRTREQAEETAKRLNETPRVEGPGALSPARIGCASPVPDVAVEVGTEAPAVAADSGYATGAQLDAALAEISRRAGSQVRDPGCECACHAGEVPAVHDPGPGAAQRYIRKRMRAFAAGRMSDSHGKTVDDRKQALAIALSEAARKGYKI